MTQWCSGAGCITDTAAHPIEADWGDYNFAAIRVADFDMEPHKNSKKFERTLPAMLEFTMPPQDFLTECQDEMVPGNAIFNLKKMADWTKSLPFMNPCQDVGGAWTVDILDTNGKPKREGSGAWKSFIGDSGIWTLAWMMVPKDLKKHLHGVEQKDEQKWVGVTYPSIWECWGRKSARVMSASIAGVLHGAADLAANIIDLWNSFGCNIAPSEVVCPLPGVVGVKTVFIMNGCKSIGFAIFTALKCVNFGIKQYGMWDRLHKEIQDCGLGSGSFKRSLCDLHCIRDASRSTTKAILAGLVDNFKILQTNLDGLMEFYIGKVQDHVAETQEKATRTASMLEKVGDVKSGVFKMFAEMKGLLSGDLHVAGRITASRALDEFKTRWSRTTVANHSETMDDLSSSVTLLLHTIRSAASERMSKADAVVQQVMSTVRGAREAAQNQNRHLGLYRASARKAKKQQDNLSGVSASMAVDLRDEIRELGTSALIMDFDRSWWAIREKLDTYFDAAENQNVALGHAIEVMNEYTSACTKSFDQLSSAHDQVARADETARSRLRNTWLAVEYELALLTAGMIDSHALLRLGRSDAFSTDLEANRSVICKGGVAGRRSAHEMLDQSWNQGFASQTWKQIQGVFMDMQLLKNRFEEENLALPKTDNLRQAKNRAAKAFGEFRSQRSNILLETTTRLCKLTQTSPAQNALQTQTAAMTQQETNLEGKLEELGAALKELVAKRGAA
jgi:hypothetical protein